MFSGVMAVPDTLVCAPGLVTVTVFWMVQANVAVPVNPSVSVAVMVVEYTPAVVGVPVMDPVVWSMARPDGSVPPSE